MSHSAYRPLAAMLMLLSGCASPLFSGLSSRIQTDSPSAGQKTSGLSTSPNAAGNSNSPDPRLSDNRTADRQTPSSAQRLSDLLAAASRKQAAGKIFEAKRDYEQVLLLDPQNMTANYRLAVIADDERRFADAERHYFVMLKQSPQNPDVLASLGWSYLLNERYDDSDRVLREALQYEPKHQTALYNLGWLYGIRGDYDRALTIFRSAGSEADAQRALAELKATAARPPQVAGAAAYNGTNRESLPIEGTWPAGTFRTLGNERQASRELSAPAPWNAGRTAANDSRSRGQTSGVFPEADAYASSSPTQANQTINYEQTAPPMTGRQQSPVITPAAVGAGMNSRRQGNTAWNAIPAGNALPPPAGSVNPPVADKFVERSQNAAGISSLPDWSGVAAAERFVLPQGDGSAHPGRNSLSGAQLTAAQLGLAAGSGGIIFPDANGDDPPLGNGSANYRPPFDQPAGAPGARTQSPANGTVQGASTSVSQLPAAARPAGVSPPPASQTTGLPPWPGRSNLATPIPTEITPTPGF